MALESHGPKQAGDAVPVFAEKAAAGMILRPVVRPVERTRPVGDTSLLPSRLSGGSQGAATAEGVFGGRRRSDWLATGQEQVAVSDGLGTMRGFVMLLGLYAVLGAVSLGGLMLWHWLR